LSSSNVEFVPFGHCSLFPISQTASGMEDDANEIFEYFSEELINLKNKHNNQGFERALTIVKTMRQLDEFVNGRDSFLELYRHNSANLSVDTQNECIRANAEIGRRILKKSHFY